jgi:stress responsive alpha/beta barrel protein
MIVHVVLFTPRADLSDDEASRLSTTLENALAHIPSIQRYKVGRRLRLGTAYDHAAPLDFHYLVLVECADRDALAKYLEHPHHQALGQLFYSTSAVALAADFETIDTDVAATIARWRRE